MITTPDQSKDVTDPIATWASHDDLLGCSVMDSRIPPRLPAPPVVGSLLELRRDPLQTLMRAGELGPICEIPLPGRRAFLFNDPSLVRRVFVDARSKYGKNTPGYSSLSMVLGEGLITGKGAHWRRHRRIMQPAFREKNVATFTDAIVRRTTNLIDGWSEGATIDLDAEMMKLSLTIVGECLLSTDLCDSTQLIGRLLPFLISEAVTRTSQLAPLPLWVPTPSNLRFRRALREFDVVIGSIIAERKAQPDPPRDLLSMLMAAEGDQAGERLSDEDLRDEVITLLTAGHDTTATALSWTFYLLSRHPEQRARVIDEIARVAGDRPLTLAQLGELPWTEAVVKEAMRLYPPIWLIARSVEEPDSIDGFTIPKGAMIFLCPWVSHRRPDIFEDPERFDPGRFVDGADAQIPKYAYFPFGGGPRICIGNNFALLKTRLVLATLLQRYLPDPVPDHPVEIRPQITLRPKHGLHMRLTRSPIAHAGSTGSDAAGGYAGLAPGA